jgi:hypothetical protein
LIRTCQDDLRGTRCHPGEPGKWNECSRPIAR